MAELKTKHFRSDFVGSVGFLVAIAAEVVPNLPRLATCLFIHI